MNLVAPDGPPGQTVPREKRCHPVPGEGQAVSGSSANDGTFPQQGKPYPENSCRVVIWIIETVYIKILTH